jgi:hypothetical protein
MAAPVLTAAAPMVRALAPIFRAYENGYSALLVTGRNLYDHVVDPNGRISPLVEVLRRECRARHGMLLLSYSMASGLDWDSVRLDNDDRRTVEQALQSHGLVNIPQDANEVIRVIRGIASLSRTPTAGLKWSDGQDLRFVFLFQFA